MTARATYPDGLKLCNKCGKTKPITDFYKNGRKSGLPKSYCKDCHKVKMREKYYQKDRETREERREKHRLAAIKCYHKNHDVSLKRSAHYRANNPEKVKAHWIAKNAIQSGKIVAPEQCERCGAKNTLEKHHPDYTKPLKIEWLCIPCHRLHHLSKESINDQKSCGAVG